MIEEIKVSSAAAWHRERAKDVTASVVGALLDSHEFTTRFELWSLKAGKLDAKDIDDDEAVRRGRLLEPVAVQLMREVRPHWQITHNTGRHTVYFRDPAARLGATPDVIAIDPERGKGVVQIKSVEAGTFRRKWQAEDGLIEPPLWIALQAIVEGYLTGSEWAAIAPLVISHGIDMPIIDVPIIPAVIERLKEESLEFWRSVEAGEPPAADFYRDADVIERMYARDEGEEIDLSKDNRILDLIAQRHELRAKAKQASEELAAVDAEIKHKMAGASLAHLAGGAKITWRQQRRAAFSSPAQMIRVLRVPPPE